MEKSCGAVCDGGIDRIPGTTSGHKKRKWALQSRNPDQLRTQKAKIGAPESEPSPASDTKK